VAWVALTPLLVALHGSALAVARAPGAGPRDVMRRGFLLGLTAGLVYFAGTLYWITDVMVTFGGLTRPVAILVNGALVIFMALYPAVFGLLVARLAATLGAAALALSPAVWVVNELGRATLFGGFPWVLLGYSQVTVLPVAQLASVFGVFGLSGLVAGVGAAAAAVVVLRGRWRAAPLAAAFVVVAAVAMWGASRVSENALATSGEPIRVGLVQGNVPQDQKWDPAYAPMIVERYSALTRDATRQGAQFVVWPESATPFYFEEDPGGREVLRLLARETGVTLLFGSDQIEWATPRRFYNSAFALTPDGHTTAYRKMHLVPFGEYVPLRDLLFFAAPLVESVGEFSPGTEPVLLPIGEHRVSTAICYEIVYASLVRRFVLEGSQLLTTITNDAWYGTTSAPYQHFEQASLRAIEHGRYLVRAANTGISGIVDPYGRVLRRTELFETTVLSGDVRFLTSRTLYARIGDLFAYASVALTLAALAVTAARPRRQVLGPRPR
jgi:apolipoprotein N-acyltransferase